MIVRATDIAGFMGRNPVAICAELLSVKGSSPRAAGTFMLIGPGEILGTIGGGALEYMVIDRSRQVIRDGLSGDELDIPLGPEIGQCCGGRVLVGMSVANAAKVDSLIARVTAEDAAEPYVFVFGAGHVGHALARALALLPVKTHVIDTRADELAGLPESVEAKVVAMPEAVVRNAPQGSAYVILTHDHALDFLIAEEALRRTDSPYVGMVGSKTKRAKFSSWYLGEGGDAGRLERLVLPIGGAGTGDKRPEVIAALAAAEIMVHIGRREVESVSGPRDDKVSGAANGC
ncbi:MAG TPA: xanthine dehydrogenase accessory protein XdhC [Arsenicitalea sp.]|jgi:xanthine dehydrogenase accessory factor|nr:xanthine dehydrogenase accessory protein XdhC [Arsenicitalea sp.]